MKKRINSGIILITTFILTLLVIMFSGLLVTSSRGALLLGSGYSDSEQAYYAAISGIEFVKSRLRDDDKFMYQSVDYESESDNISKYEKDNRSDQDPNSSIEVFYNEKEGWILGYIDRHVKDKSKYRSKFRISFAFVEKPASSKKNDFNFTNKDSFLKFRDKDGIRDNGLRNFRDALGIKYLSCNNIFKKTHSDENFSYGFKYNINGGYEPDKKIPIKTCYVVAQGIAGDTVRYVEASLGRLEDYELDSCTTANIDIDVMLANPRGTFLFNTVSKTKKANIRSGSSISIESPSLSSIEAFKAGETGGAIYTKNLVINSTNISGANISDQVHHTIDASHLGGSGIEGILEHSFKDYEYSKIRHDVLKAGLSGKMSMSATEKPAYIFLRNSNGDYKYVKEVDIDKIGGSELSGDERIAFLQKSVEFKKDEIEDLKFNNIRGLDGFTVSPINMTNEHGHNYKSLTVKVTTPIDFKNGVTFACLEQVGTSNSYKLAGKSNFNVKLGSRGTLLSEKSIDILGNLTGTGKVVSGKNVAFYGGSIFETDENTGVAVFASNDVSIYPSQSQTNVQNACNNIISSGWSNLILTTTGNADFIDSKCTNYQTLANKLARADSGRIDADGNTISVRGGLKAILGTYVTYEQIDEIIMQTVLQNSVGGQKPKEYNSRFMIVSNSGFKKMDTPEYHVAIFDTDKSESEIPTNADIDASNCNIISLRKGEDSSSPTINIWLKKSNGSVAGVNATDEEFKKSIISEDYINRTVVPSDPDDPTSADISGDAFCQIVDNHYIFNSTLFASDQSLQLNSLSADNSVSHLLNYTVPDANIDTFQGDDINKIYLRKTIEEVVFPSNNDTLITGLVFAKGGNITIDALGAAINIRGGFIAYEKNIIVNNSKYMVLTYDPDFMPLFKAGALTKNNFTTTFN